MDNSRNRQNENLGVNKMGKNIKKSPIHQPNFAASNPSNRQQPQPQVYNISKNDFRSIVQQLTGSPSQEPLLPLPLPRPSQNPPKPQSMRLQRIRPPPLTPINHNRPQLPVPVPVPVPHVASPRPAQYGQQMPPLNHGEQIWSNTAESPISAYMRYLQTSMVDPGYRDHQGFTQSQPQPQVPGQFRPPLPAPPSFPSHPHPQPQLPGQFRPPQPPSFPPQPQPQVSGQFRPPPQPPSAMPPFPSPRGGNAPFLPMNNNLPSPTSQFLLPSPTGYMNLLSPRSPYPLLSPGVHFPPPLTPNFSFSPMMRQQGVLGPGPGPGPQPPPLSPGLFPLSPSGFFPMFSPMWRNQ